MRAFLVVISLIIVAILAIILFTGEEELADLIPTSTPSPVAFVTATTSPGIGGGPEEFSLEEQSDSNEEGDVTLTETSDGRLNIVLTVDNVPANLSQPAHIHNGSCDELGSVRYNLNPVVNGRSETTLSMTLAQLTAQLPLAINVHRSASQMNVNVACADLDL